MIIILTLFSSKTMRIQKKNCAIFAYTQRWIVTAQDRWAVTELQNWTLNLTAEPLKSDLIDLAIFLSRPTEIAPDHKQKMLWKQKHAKFAPLPLCVPRFTSRSCRDFRSIILWIRSTLSYTTRLNTLNQELVFISLTVSDKLGRYTCTRHRRTRFRLSELSHNGMSESNWFNPTHTGQHSAVFGPWLVEFKIVPHWLTAVKAFCWWRHAFVCVWCTTSSQNGMVSRERLE